MCTFDIYSRFSFVDCRATIYMSVASMSKQTSLAQLSQLGSAFSANSAGSAFNYCHFAIIRCKATALKQTRPNFEDRGLSINGHVNQSAQVHTEPHPELQGHPPKHRLLASLAVSQKAPQGGGQGGTVIISISIAGGSSPCKNTARPDGRGSTNFNMGLVPHVEAEYINQHRHNAVQAVRLHLFACHLREVEHAPGQQLCPHDAAPPHIGLCLQQLGLSECPVSPPWEGGGGRTTMAASGSKPPNTTIAMELWSARHCKRTKP